MAETSQPEETIDHTDMEDGVSVGAFAEPEAESETTTSAETANEEEAAAPDEARNAIYNRHRDARNQEITGRSGDADESVLAAQAGVESAESSPATADTPHLVSPDGFETSSGTGEPVGQGVRLSVYGQEQYVPEADVLQAGIQTLQKERAAEYRMQQAAEAERNVRTYHEQLDAYRARLMKMEEDLQAGKLPTRTNSVEASQSPPVSGATPTLDEARIAERAQSFAQAIYQGDAEETAKAVQALLSDVAQGRTATPPSVDVNQVVETAMARMRDEAAQASDEERRSRVNTTFRTEFGSVQAHPEAFAVAQTRFNALLGDPDNQGRTLEDMAREAGNHALAHFPEIASPEQRSDDVAAALDGRRQLKASTVVRQPTSSQRKPAPATKAYPSNSEYVQQMRSSRGQPSL